MPLEIAQQFLRYSQPQFKVFIVESKYLIDIYQSRFIEV